MSQRKLVEVCITEPSRSAFSGIPSTLDSPFNHPPRLHYSNWWMNDDDSVTIVGGEGRFSPDEHRNFDYCGCHAHVVCKINIQQYISLIALWKFHFRQTFK